MATEVQVPALGESITQAVLIKWLKADGERVELDEPICELETDKANVEVPATAGGVLQRISQEGQTVAVGEPIARIEASAAAEKPSAPAQAPQQPPAPAQPAPPAPPAPPTPAPLALEDFSPAVRSLLQEHQLDPARIKATGPGGRLTRADVEQYLADQPQPPPALPPQELPTATPAPWSPPLMHAAAQKTAGPRSPEPPPLPPRPAAPAQADQPAQAPAPAQPGTRREPMSKIRQRIAQTLVHAQQTAAILTTFNEIDLSQIIALRQKYKQEFEQTHGVGLGYVSFFARAAVSALAQFPRLNASIDGSDIVYHDAVHLGIAVSTERGLAVPVLRDVQRMDLPRIESEIKRLAAATRAGKLTPDELAGATFSITNGGVFGSLLSTPILTPPQSGILGMHTIQKRPVAVDDRVEIRPMMYVALSYDHRLVDGREAIGFLVRLKQLLEEPGRMMLGV